MPGKLIPEIRKLGLSTALSRFGHRRHLPLIGYLILVIAVAWAFQSSQNTASQARHSQAQQTNQEFVIACEQGNEVRRAVINVLEGYVMQTKFAYKQHQINHVAEVRDLNNLKKNIASMAPKDCSKLVNTVSKSPTKQGK